MSSTAAAGSRAEAASTGQDVRSPEADPWQETLRRFAGSTGDDPAVADEALRRLGAGLLTVRDMRLVLLGTAHLPGWQPVRRAVIDVLADDVESARHVLVTHTQIEVLPPPRYEEVPPEHGGTGAAFAAVVGAAGAQVTGPARQARTGREAKDRAALALLAALAGVEPPDRGGAAGRLVLPGMLTEVFEHRLLRALSTGRGPGPELEGEALRRAGTGRLRHRDLYLLLLTARGREWTRTRTAALRRAAAMPPAPARLLHWYAEQHGGGEGHGLSYEEEPAPAGGRHRVRALLRAERTWSGPERTAWSRGTAKHYACCALLAELAGLPEPAPQVEDKRAGTVRITVPAQGQDPVRTLNKHCQREAITKPESTLRTLGSRVECTYRCRHRASDLQVQATAVGPDKNAARGAAALKLLRELASIDTPALPGIPAVPGDAGDRRSPGPGPAATPPAPSPARLHEAVAAGCPVSFVPARGSGPAVWWVRDDGSRSRALPVTGLSAPPAAGWRAGLADGLPAVHRAGADADPTAVFWQRAVHIALQLVRARLVHPALDGRGHAVWRVGPVPADAEDALTALAAAAPPGAVLSSGPGSGSGSGSGTSARQAILACCDAVADALVRTPAAVLCGAGPWTAPVPGPVTAGTQGAVRGWLDGVEDLADGGPAPLLVLRVRPPGDEQAAADRLTADLHLAPAGSCTTVSVPAGSGPAGSGPSGSGPAAAGPGMPDEVAAARVWAGTARVGGEDADTVRPRVRRVLRRTARLHQAPAALAALAGEENPRQCVLRSGDIVALLEQEAELAGAGVRVVWPERLRTALSAAAVVGTPDGGTDEGSPAGPGRAAGERPRFSVTALLDFRWQVALDGADLSEEEMDALAEAARPLVRVRGQWVLADPVLRRRARHRLLGRLPGTQALTAALTGTVTVADDTVACRPAGPLADLIGVLRRGEHHPEAVPSPAGLTAALRGYQQRALTWLAHTTRLGFGAVLADDMGLGKTLTALAFTLHHQQCAPGPALVVCPASLVATWCREAARFAPRLPVVAYHGAERTLEAVTDTTLVVTTYDLLRRDAARLAERHWGLVVADEAQHAKNPASATARRLRALPSTTRLALSGTPVENNLSELWSLLDWTNPGLFGPLTAFRSRWANAAEKNPDGAEATELGRIVAPFLLRRRKTDPGIAPELPAKIDRPRPVQLTTEQAGLYEAVVRETLQQIRDARGIERNGLVFKLLTALKQITNHPAHYLREQPPTSGESPAFTARSAKTAALVDLLETIRASGEAALVFTSYVAMGHLLTAHLTHLGHDPLFLHGATPLAERTRRVDAFQAGRHPVMVLSLKAAGTGLTLTRAAHVVHYDRSWNAAVEDQATDRAHRIGQHRTVTVHRLITRHTVEDRIDELLTRKRALASAVLTGGDRALTRLTDRELADLVALGEHR